MLPAHMLPDQPVGITKDTAFQHVSNSNELDIRAKLVCFRYQSWLDLVRILKSIHQPAVRLYGVCQSILLPQMGESGCHLLALRQLGTPGHCRPTSVPHPNISTLGNSTNYTQLWLHPFLSRYPFSDLRFQNMLKLTPQVILFAVWTDLFKFTF